MNYACISNQSFSTKKDLSVKKKLSAEAESRKEFMQNHRLSIHVDSSTEEAEIKIIKR